MFVITDHGSDMRRLAYIEIKTRQLRYLSTDLKWDVDGFQVSPDGKAVAFTTNEDGVSKLHILDVSTRKYQTVSGLPTDQISDLKWHNNSVDLAFNLKSHQAPNDIYSTDMKTLKVEQWTKANAEAIKFSELPDPELIHWQSFDDKMVSGFIYRPPAKFVGKRPVIVDIHGGPEEQYRPDFLYEQNYLINELGIAKIYPNVLSMATAFELPFRIADPLTL